MDIKLIAYELLLGTAAAVFFALLMYAPPKTIPCSALTGGVSYIIYRLITAEGGADYFGYFIATFAVAVLSEIYARLYKMPATIFIFPAIIPLVPGVGLYRTMLYLVESDYDSFRRVGSNTIFAFCSMAAAIAITGAVARGISSYLHVRRQKKNIRANMRREMNSRRNNV